ncbi:hypothetical protein [Pseudooceanicola sp.]|uniref:hypothetical protein n=1 Tax=Pseudooceanicola sp. TaxID=1914328 RepID=UPI0040595B2A
MQALPVRTVVRGNPPTSDHQIDPVQLTVLLEAIEATAAGLGALSYRDTFAELSGISPVSANDKAIVLRDDDLGLRGIYTYDGSAWSKSAHLPAAFTDSLSNLLAVQGLEALYEQLVGEGLSFQGAWDASGGSFPGEASAGDTYIVSEAGTVGAVSFEEADRLIALIDSASTSVYPGNWIRLPAIPTAWRLEFAFVTDGTIGPFALPGDPVSARQVTLYFGGAKQRAVTDYDVVDMESAPSGKGLQFTTAPAAGVVCHGMIETPVGSTTTIEPYQILMPDGLNVEAFLSKLSGGFTTRDALVTWWALFKNLVPAGVVTMAGDLSYLVDPDYTQIADLPGLRPFGTWDWGHFGAEYAGAADNTAKMQAAVTAAELLVGPRFLRSTGPALRWDDEVTFTKPDWHFDFGSTVIKGQQWDDWGAHNGIDFAGSRYAGMLTGRGTAGITTSLSANVKKGSRVLPLASTANVSIGDGLELRSATELWYSGETATGEVFDGDGSTTVFNLSDPVIYEANFEVYVDDEELDPDDYTVSGTTLTFDVAPAAGTENIEVLHYGYTRKLEGLRIVDVDSGANTVTVDAPTRFSYDVDNHAVEVFTWKPVKRPTITGGHWEGPGADHDGYTNGFGPSPFGLIGAVDFEVRPRSIKGFPGRAGGGNYCIDGVVECYDIEGLPEGFGVPVEGGGWSGYYSFFFGRSHRITMLLGACKRVRHSADGSGSHDCRVVGANCIENHASSLTVHDGCDGWVYDRCTGISSSHYGAQWRGGSVKYVDCDLRADPDGGNEYGLTVLGGRASDMVRVIEIIDTDIDANYSALYLTAPNLDVRIRGGAHTTDDNAFPAYLIGCPSVAGFSVRQALIDAGGSAHCIRFSDDALAEGDYVFIDDNRLIGATDVPVDVQSTEDKVNIRAKGNLLDPTMKAVLRYDARNTNSDGPVFDVGPNYSGTDVIWREDKIGDEDNFFDSGNAAAGITIEVGGVELTAAGGSYTVTNANYQRDGRTTSFTADVTITSFGTLSASGNPIRLKGLPFEGLTTMNQTLQPIMYSGMPHAWGGKIIYQRVMFGQKELRLHYSDTAVDGGSNYAELKPTVCQDGCAFRIGGTYQSNTWS